MKTSSASANPEPPSLQTARGFAGTNLALPGFGSLMAKRRVGWPQAALTVVGFGLTLVGGIPFIVWCLHNLSAFYDNQADQLELFRELWLRLCWPLVGFALVSTSWLWSLTTNAAILRSAKRERNPEKPPKLH